MAMTNTRELLSQFARERSEPAFAELVQRHIDLVYSIALRRLNGDTHLAQDITQLVFCDLARKAGSLPPNVVLAAWLYRHTTFRACEVVRAEGRRRAREQTAMEMTSLHESADPWTHLAPALDDAVSQLNARDREAIVLRFFERLDLRTIGAALGASDDAVQKRIARALEKLHRILAKRGATLSVGSLTALLGAHTVAGAPAGFASTVSASALAATAGAGGLTLMLVNLMTMTKLKIGAISAIVIAAVVTPLVIQQQSIAKLRRENHQVTERQALRAQEQTPAANRSLTDEQHRELLRLRGEVALLRKDSQELARLRKERKVAAVGGATALPVLTAESWADVGLHSPDAALQTFFWAARHDDAEFVRQLIRWKKDDSVPDFDGLEKIVESLIPGTIHYARKLESIRILSQEQIDEQTARMRVEFAPGAGKPPKQQDLLFVKEESDWKPVFSVWSPEKGSIQGALAAPPSL
jgi:RNA polymerase sigma factor (sigma-70 family)